jgi:hypothetical protein
MSSTKVIIAGIAFLIGGWLAFDGARAWVTGNYTTAKTGPYAGQLGLWSRVVSALGMDPRSQLIKGLHVGLGLWWLLAMIAFALQPVLGWWALLASSILTLWYLPFGTVLSVIELCLLFLPQIRALR